MRKLLRLSSLLGVLTALTALSGTSGAIAATDHQKNGTETFVDVIDCTGNLYNTTITFNEVSREGRNQIQKTGTFVAAPLEAGQPASGHFTGGQTVRASDDGSFSLASHFRISGKYADGTPFRMYQQAQFRAAADGSTVKDRFHNSCAA